MKKFGMFLMVLSLCWFSIGCGEGTPTNGTGTETMNDENGDPTFNDDGTEPTDPIEP